MILGFVCCKRNNMVIDTSQQTVFFKRTNTSQTNLYDDHLDVHLFSITHGATIPAFSQIIIDVSNGQYFSSTWMTLLYFPKHMNNIC